MTCVSNVIASRSDGGFGIGASSTSASETVRGGAASAPVAHSTRSTASTIAARPACSSSSSEPVPGTGRPPRAWPAAASTTRCDRRRRWRQGSRRGRGGTSEPSPFRPGPASAAVTSEQRHAREGVHDVARPRRPGNAAAMGVDRTHTHRRLDRRRGLAPPACSPTFPSWSSDLHPQSARRPVCLELLEADVAGCAPGLRVVR